MKTRQNTTNSTLREVWPWYSRSNICAITEKIDLKFCKLTFSLISNHFYLKTPVNTSEITKFKKLLDLGKGYYNGKNRIL